MILRRPTIILLFSSLLTCTPVPTEPKATVSNAVAVVDFELSGGRADAKDWAFGLADALVPETARGSVGNGANNSALTEP
jgi:hypothetical protein